MMIGQFMLLFPYLNGAEGLFCIFQSLIPNFFVPLRPYYVLCAHVCLC